nr:mannitol dehydrogenase family protein [Roseospira visakhapatnamensis]
MGYGAFARAFLSTYVDETLDRTGGDWGVVAARLHSGVVELDALDARDRIVTVVAADDDGLLVRRVGCLVDTSHPGRDGLDALLAIFERESLSLVSLTITEKGYCSRAGELDEAHPDLRHDLANPAAPRTAVGVLVAGLRRRMALDRGGLTILSCDNLPENGAVCRSVVLGFAALVDADLAAWIAAHVSFPCTMVDRIVPALDEAGRTLLREIGVEDTDAIVCEPFRQWVIEDRFVRGRPDFDLAGAEFVADVRPFEEMKLRMLNGAHSFLAYLGALAGHATIADCVADPAFRDAARDLMTLEQAPTLAMPDGIDLTAYADALIRRFSNSRLNHRTTQIATDGTQKLPQRMLASIRIHMAHDRPWPRLALGLAGWMAYCRGTDDTGTPLPLNDPHADALRAIAASTPDGPAYVAAMLEGSTVFPADLAASPSFREPVDAAYRTLRRDGARAAVAGLGKDA